MTEQELRLLVRQAIAHHRGHPSTRETVAPVTVYRQHFSHGMFTLPAEPGGSCIVEPTVECTHCGFCQSYGH